MITYREDKEVAHFKILDSFHKIFEDKTKWHLRTEHFIKTQKNGVVLNPILFFRMQHAFRPKSLNYVNIYVIELDSNKEP